MTEQEKNKTVKLGDLIGNDSEEEFANFDLTEIQAVLDELQKGDPIDLAHGERLQQQALRGADILIGFLGKIVKTVGFLETKVNAAKNRAAMEFKNPDGSKTTADMRKFASESDPKVEELEIKLARSKASKLVLEKKFDVIIKLHHHMKDITTGMRRTVLGFPQGNTEKNDMSGWG
jgi:hypothetical protein